MNKQEETSLIWLLAQKETMTELNNQEKAFIHDYFQTALEEELLSNTSRAIMKSIIKKLTDEE